MEERKLRIAEFIESIDGGEVNGSTVLMGGAASPSVGLMSTQNGRNCINDTKDACNKSINDGDCKNVSGCCNNSKNGGACNNAYDQSIQERPNIAGICM